ncbi:13925_t:CDS:2, partial [Funneliformis geosporum]
RHILEILSDDDTEFQGLHNNNKKSRLMNDTDSVIKKQIEQLIEMTQDQFDKSKTIINNQRDTNHKLDEIVTVIREIKAQVTRIERAEDNNWWITTVTHTIKDLMHTVKYPSDDKL